jgi:hypothetical protein
LVPFYQKELSIKVASSSDSQIKYSHQFEFVGTFLFYGRSGGTAREMTEFLDELLQPVTSNEVIKNARTNIPTSNYHNSCKEKVFGQRDAFRRSV